MRTCPNCGASVADTDEFCNNCGTYLAWLKPDDADQPAPAEAAPEQPHAVAPAKPVVQRRSRATPMPVKSTQDGLRCPVCGTVNPAGAKFCRNCGSTLLETVAPQQVSRWRWPRWLRIRGSGGSPWPRRIVALVVLAVLVVAGILLFPLAKNLVQDTRDKLSTAVAITPSKTVGSAEVPGHPAGAAVDGVSNQYWGAPAVGDSAQFTFAQPFRLLGVVITPGASTEPAVFRQQARPTAVDLVVTSSNGETRTLSITLADKPGPQNTDTGISDVTTIRLIIRAATAQTPSQSIAIGEIEFFKRS